MWSNYTSIPALKAAKRNYGLHIGMDELSNPTENDANEVNVNDYNMTAWILAGNYISFTSGLCEQYVKSLGLTPSGFDFLFRTRLRALGQQTPPEPVLIP